MEHSEQIYFNNNINHNNSIKPINSRIIPLNSKNIINNNNSQIINKGNIKEKILIYYYLFPLWFLKRNKTFKSIYFIKDRICNYFSIEKMNELIKYLDIFEEKNLKAKINNIEYINLYNNNFENGCINGGINNTTEIIK